MREAFLALAILSSVVPADAEQPGAGSRVKPVAPVILQPAPALALPGSKAVSGPTIKCTLTVRRIGPLTLDDAFVTIANQIVEVRSNVEPPGLDPLLKGAVLRLDESGTAFGANRTMSGLVLFRSGQMMDQLSDQEVPHADALRTDAVHAEDQGPPPPQDELVFAKSGSVSGRIIDVAGDVLMVRDRAGTVQKMSLKSVTYVRSPRAFVFTISGQPSADQSRTHVDSISFRPTANSIMLGDQVMVGKPRGIFDDDLDDPLMPAANPISTPTRARQFERGDFGLSPQRPFSAWP